MRRGIEHFATGVMFAVEDVECYLAMEKPNLMFVHFGEPDYTGHRPAAPSEANAPGRNGRRRAGHPHPA